MHSSHLAQTHRLVRAPHVRSLHLGSADAGRRGGATGDDDARRLRVVRLEFGLDGDASSGVLYHRQNFVRKGDLLKLMSADGEA